MPGLWCGERVGFLDAIDPPDDAAAAHADLNEPTRNLNKRQQIARLYAKDSSRGIESPDSVPARLNLSQKSRC